MKRLGTMTGVSRAGRLIIAGMLAASLGVAGCGGSSNSSSTSSTQSATHTTPSPASSAALIRTASLIAPASAMTGFSTSGAPQTATSAQLWAQSSSESDEVAHEASRLKGEGFREGVGQRYTGTGGAAALSLALVFNSSEGANKEVTHYLQVDPHYGLHVESVKVPAIPGSVVVGEGPAGNVLVATGRCFLLVGDELGTGSTQAHVNAVPIAAASALYAQLKDICAE